MPIRSEHHRGNSTVVNYIIERTVVVLNTIRSVHGVQDRSLYVCR